jgi:cell division protein FtsL
MARKSGKRQGGKRTASVAVSYPAKSWFALFALLLLLTGSATGVIFSTHKSRHLLNDLHGLENQRNALQVEWGQLLLEQSSLVSQGRIENLAIAELGMKIPAVENVVVVASE